MVFLLGASDDGMDEFRTAAESTRSFRVKKAYR
jgi:hypothetical protein